MILAWIPNQSHLTIGAGLGMPEPVVQTASVLDKARSILFSHHLSGDAHHCVPVPNDGYLFTLGSVADCGGMLIHK